jgi:hypothetical protein
MPFAPKVQPLPGHAVFVPGLQGPGGRRSTAFYAVDGRAALPSAGGVAAGVCSQLLQCAKLGGRAALGGWVDTGCFPAEIEIQALRAVSAASGLGPPASGGLAPPSKRRRCRRNDPRHTDDRATGRTLLRIRAQ